MGITTSLFGRNPNNPEHNESSPEAQSAPARRLTRRARPRESVTPLQSEEDANVNILPRSRRRRRVASISTRMTRQRMESQREQSDHVDELAGTQGEVPQAQGVHLSASTEANSFSDLRGRNDNVLFSDTETHISFSASGQHVSFYYVPSEQPPDMQIVVMGIRRLGDNESWFIYILRRESGEPGDSERNDRLLQTLVNLSHNLPTSYEDLQFLQDFMGPAINPGLTPEQILSLEKHTADKSGSCSICLDNVDIGQEMRSLHCAHEYHMDCIDVWLKVKNSCPLCRVKVVE